MSNNLYSRLNKGHLFVLSAPAGTGKTTLVHRLVHEFPTIVQSISYTTRKPRIHEIADEHYHFISTEKFEKMVEEGRFLEHVKLYGDYYGTSKDDVEKLCNEGKHVILVIDTQGAMRLKQLHAPAIYIFVSPPSLDILKIRLRDRGTEDIKVQDERLTFAEQELAFAQFYDYHFINDRLEEAYDILRSIFIAESHKTSQAG